jgi:hypothetical protein
MKLDGEGFRPSSIPGLGTTVLGRIKEKIGFGFGMHWNGSYGGLPSKLFFF